MKFMLDELINNYRDIYSEITESIRSKLYFKLHFYNIIKEIARNISTSKLNYLELFNFPREEDIHNRGYFHSRNNLKKHFKQEINNNLLHEIQEPNQIREFNKRFLNESLDCLDRSIYWFLNYKRNLDKYSLNAKIQNFYYSELFIHLSISRFLGLAFTWIPDLGIPFKVQIAKVSDDSSKSFEENMKIKVNIQSGGGMHKMIFVQIRNHIEESIILIPPTLACWFSPSYITSMLKKSRENLVYDISKPQNNPWIPLHETSAKSFRELCFLEGLDTYTYLDPDFYEFSYGEYEASEEYLKWGHREHLLGILIKWMADRLKEINAENKIREILGYLKDFDKGLYPDSMERTIETIKFIFGEYIE